ncbi:hypothetical protein V6M85_08615 [Sulfolobus tengchongensis]|uniref:Uncharacterized protein n=1 Tax=Sulfolobus tengchongensis TaxID=207809 RepID=A0AAX4KY40_9CREN
MNYAKFWIRFKEWALTTDEDSNLPYRLRNIVKVIKQNPDITLVKLAGYLDTDAIYLAKYLRANYKSIAENNT